jgi:hypothetical protein
MITIRRTVPSYATTPQAHDVAKDHYRWARTHGFSDEAILKSIGLPAPDMPNPQAVIDALRRTWLAMQCGWRIVDHRKPMKAAAE